MITKDVYGNADFIFGVDMNRLMIDNSAYSALIANMTDVAKKQIAANSEILSFNITRRQVKKGLSLNTLGSPSIPEVFTNETISHQVLGSISEMKEVPLFVTERDARPAIVTERDARPAIVAERDARPTLVAERDARPTLVAERDARPTLVDGQFSGIKYLTASDIGLSKQTAGTYQYELSISLVDGFIPTISKLLKKLYRTNNDVSDYIALLDIPDNYDPIKQKSKISIRKTKTDEMSKTYVDALSYFQNLKNISTEYKRAASLIASAGASKESIGTFQKRLNTVISKLEGLISKTETGVSPSSVANKPSNSGLPNTPTVEIKQSFGNTINVECKNDKYVDYFKGKGKIGGGLNAYSNIEVRNSTPETTYLKAPMTSIEMLETRGVSLDVTPSSEDNMCEVENKQTMSTEKFIGASATSTGGLLKDNLSPIDLSTVSIGSLVSTNDINIAVSSMTPKLSSVNSFQTPVDNITKGTTTGGRTGMVFDPQPSIISTGGTDTPSPVDTLSRTMVLVATQGSDVETCSTGGATPMLKSLQWVSLNDIAAPKGATMLCKQENGSLEVANQFFLMEVK